MLTVTATGTGGQLVPLGIIANNPTIDITGAQISASTATTAGVTGPEFTVSFKITGLSGTEGTTTVTIPKTAVPGGLIPVVYLDGTLGPDAPALPAQSYTQDANNYYVTFTTHFSTHTVTIEFIPPSGSSGANTTSITGTTEFVPASGPGGNTSSGSGGIPEFPMQLGAALLTIAVILVSYVSVRHGLRRNKGSQTSHDHFAVLLLLAFIILGSFLSVPFTHGQIPAVRTISLPAGSEPLSVAYDSGKGEVFVTDFGADSVSVISDASNSVVATVPVGHFPDRIAYDSGKGEVFVTNVGDNTVSVISDTSDTVVATVAVGTYPYGIAYDSGKGEVFVTNYDSNTTSVINDSNDNVVATIPSRSAPHGIAYDSGKGEVFVTNYDSDTVQVISDVSNTVVATITVGKEPNRVAYDPDKGEVFVTNQGTNTVSVISDGTNSVVATVRVGRSPVGIAYDSDKGIVFVVNNGSNSTSLIDEGDDQVVGNFTVGSAPYDAAYDFAKGEVFVADYGSNTVSLISDASLSTTAVSLTVTATGAGGQQVPLGISTNNPTINFTDVAISTGMLTTSGAVEQSVTISFTISGQSGSNGMTTVTIPKADVPAGLTPTVYIDGSPALGQSYSQDANNYYVTFANHFSTHTVTIEFIPPSGSGGSNSSSEAGGIPEFPAQLEFALLVIAVVVTSYMLAIRGKGRGEGPPPTR